MNKHEDPMNRKQLPDKETIMNGRRETGEIGKQINRLQDHVSDLGMGIGEMSDALVAVCLPDGTPCTKENGATEPNGSPLVVSLQRLDDRVSSLVQQVININERLEL